jgi:hypothetical protein
VIALFFLRFYRTSRDRIFLFFFGAFGAFAVHWLALAIANPESETRHLIFLIRLVAFLLIIAGVVDKNRRSRAASRASEP